MDLAAPTIRWMLRHDLEAVLAIERASFEFPWTEQEFVGRLRRRNTIGLVVEARDHAGHERVVGYLLYELHAGRFRVVNVAVDPAARRRGLGRQLLQKLIGKLDPRGRRCVRLEVRETNVAAQLFFRALGFRAVHVLRAFYDDTDDDAYVFEFRVPRREVADADR